jgi:hypothetical protein
MYQSEENPHGAVMPTFRITQQTPTGARREEGAMAKLHARPSNQYRYEHYDPFTGSF